MHPWNTSLIKSDNEAVKYTYLSSGRHPMSDHPIFSGPVGIMSGDNPAVEPTIKGGHNALRAKLKSMGLPHDVVQGRYGNPETSIVIHNPTREQMVALGKDFGQESVIFGSGNGQHHLIYTNGPNEGKYHISDKFHLSYQRPADNYTEIPGHGFMSLDFDFDKIHG